MKQVARISISLIRRPDGLRSIDEKAVAMLVESISRIGLLQPICVFHGQLDTDSTRTWTVIP